MQKMRKIIAFIPVRGDSKSIPLKGTDHAASLEPDGVRKLVRDCKAVYKALQYKKRCFRNRIRTTR
jgi:sialic acid synthase SpsE